MIYDIINCGQQELPLLMNFIQNHWKEGHPFSKSETLIRFQHWNKKKYYNFLLAINKSTKEVDGIIGYIPTSQYDDSLIENKDYWGAIWKVREDVINEDINMLGFYLWEKLHNTIQSHSYGSVGISSIAKKIYKKLSQKTGVLNQYYILRNQKEDYAIAIAPINNNILNLPVESSQIKEIDIDDTTNINAFYRPYKSVKYLINRYKKHPIYKYSFISILDKAILVTRTISVNNSKAIRIVDCLGTLDGLPNIYNDFQTLLMNQNAEYIDFINHGIDKSVFLNMGFKKLDPDEEIIIPNYFEPFERRNIKIEFAYKTPFDNYTIFKGDSDQDRPNII